MRLLAPYAMLGDWTIRDEERYSFLSMSDLSFILSSFSLLCPPCPKI
jgi:hypothetical protein